MDYRYKKVPFGTSSSRFKLKEFEENVKNKNQVEVNQSMVGLDGTTGMG